jgi:arylsulfatase A-like enzyme
LIIFNKHRMKKKLIILLFFISQITIAQKERPNIVWLTFEDTSPQFIGCYGNKATKTPFMDSLAKIGTRFTRAFSTGSVCSPSRTAIITGMKTYTTGTGHHRSNYPIPAFVKGFPYYMKNAGYYCTNNEKTDYNIAKHWDFTKEAWNESSTKAGYWNRPAGQPFFAVFNFASSHQSRTMTENYQYYENNVLKQLPKHLQIADNDVIMPFFFNNTPEMRRNMARVYNSKALADYEMKQVFDRLKREKLLENTIVFCFSDHGEGIPRVKTNGIGMGYQVPFIMVIPEKYKKDFPFKTGTTNDQLIDFCDLAPTVLDIANTEIPIHFQGHSIVKHQNQSLYLSTDASGESNDLARTIIKGKYAYTRVFMPFIQELRYQNYIDKADITVQIRKDFAENKLNETQKQMLLPRSAEFLYDYENDFWQVNNLALDKKNEALLNEFRTDLKNHLIEQRDVMFLPESQFVGVSKKMMLHEFRKSDDNYPVKRIIDIAMLSGLKTKEACVQQVKALNDKDLTVQYWGAMGLKSQNEKMLKSNLSLLKKHLSDEKLSAVSKVVLATALNEKLGDIDSKNYIEKTVLGDNADLSWLAFQLVMYQKNRLEFESVTRHFLATQKTQRDWWKAKTSASMLLYLLGKEPFKNSDE